MLLQSHNAVTTFHLAGRVAFAATALSVCLFSPRACMAGGQLELRVVDADTNQPIAVRMHLTDAKGRTRHPRGALAGKGYFIVDGQIVLSLHPGPYQFRIERGLEYVEQFGHFLIEPNAKDNKTVALKRFVDMSELGWRSGDILVHRRAGELALIQAAEELHIVRTVPRRRKDPDERVISSDGTGGTLLAYALDASHQSFNAPSPIESGALIRQFRKDNSVLLHAADVLAQDLPMWIASGRLDSVGVLLPFATPDRDTVAIDPKKFPGQRGQGRWREHVYFELIEAGIQLTPMATSRAGTSRESAGALRTYAFTGDEIDASAWWQAVRAGQVVNTGGPLIIPQVNGQLPGHVFQADESVELNIALTLHTRSKVSYFEVIRNGEVIQEIPLEEWVQQRGKIPPVVFEHSGWLSLRAVIDDAEQYRFAATAPYYVEVGGRRRVSREAVEFFLKWAQRRQREIENGPSKHLGRFHQAAVRFWQAQLTAATVN